MAVTQYIGSRYLPLFADPAEWSIENTYEALTIVLHEGNSFTSKQPVPKGIDINDTAYWGESGNYNAQVESYRSEVARLREQTQELAASLPDSEFDASNTVKDYVDTKVRDETQAIETITKDVASLKINSEDCIEFATLAYRNAEFLGTASGDRPFRQGMTVFPLAGNWDSQKYYAASAINPSGSDSDVSIEIIDLATRAVVSSIQLNESETSAIVTHGGCLFTYGTLLYVPIYTNDTSSAKRIRTYSVLNPSAPVFVGDMSYGDTPIAVPFAYTENGFIGYGTPKEETNEQGIYLWKENEQANWLFDISPRATKLGKRPQPYSYDPVNEHVIVPFADCCGYLTYDMQGNLIGHKSISREIGFVTVGELETVVKHGDNVWFAGFNNTGLGTIFSYGIWRWTPEINGISIAPQGRSGSAAYNIRLNQNNTMYPMESSYSTTQTIELAVPDDAVNMAKYLSHFKGTNIFQTGDYDACIEIGNYTGRFSANNHFATNGYFIYNFDGIIHGLFNFANVDATALLSELKNGYSVNGVYTDCGKPVAVVIMSSNVTFTTDSGNYSHGEDFYKFRFMSSSVRVACKTANFNLTDCVFEKCDVIGAKQPRILYSRLAISTFVAVTVSLATFDASVYVIDDGTVLIGCFIIDGIDSTSSLLPDKAYYVGLLGNVFNAWHILPLAGSRRLMCVSDRLHSSDLTFVYNNAGAAALGTVTMRVASNNLTLTSDYESVSSFNVWT